MYDGIQTQNTHSNEVNHMQEQLENAIRSQPFVPFRVGMSNGKQYTVRHPENCILTKHFLVVYDHQQELVDNLYLLHVASISPEHSPEHKSEA